MVDIKYEIYKNDYNRKYENKSFRDLKEFQDWMFGLMHQPYHNPYRKNMNFADGVVNGKFSMSSAARIEVQPKQFGEVYWVHCVSDHDKIIFSDGNYTNGECYISEGFKEFMRDCIARRDGKEQCFPFGEIYGYISRPSLDSIIKNAEECRGNSYDSGDRDQGPLLRG